MSGFIKIHRKVCDHPMFQGRPDWLGAWVMMIGEANYRDAHLARGELRMSQERMCKMFGWTRKKVRYFLDELSSNGMILRAEEGSKKGRLGAKITICNYSKYQDSKDSKGQSGASEGPHTERRKKEEKVKELFSDRFDEFWDAFADKRDRPNAEIAWREAVKRAPPDEIIAGAKRYREWMKAQGDRAPTPKMAQGWLNSSRWQDELKIKGRAINGSLNPYSLKDNMPTDFVTSYVD